MLYGKQVSNIRISEQITEIAKQETNISIEVLFISTYKWNNLQL